MNYKLFLYLFVFKRKICYVFFDYDFYYIRDSKNIKRLKSYVKLKIILKFYKSIKSVATLLEGDYNLLSNYIKTKNNFIVQYSESDEFYMILEKTRNFEKPINPYYVLVGNNASATNQHIDILNKLAKFKNDNIYIIVPISYSGEQPYINSVITKGIELFGKKFIPLTTFISKDEYISILNKCTVGVFNNNRQQGIGNINLLSILGSKIYLRKDTVMWDEFVNKRKLCFYDIDDIGNNDFRKFVEFSQNKIEWNSKIIKEYSYNEKFLDLCIKVFDD